MNMQHVSSPACIVPLCCLLIMNGIYASTGFASEILQDAKDYSTHAGRLV